MRGFCDETYVIYVRKVKNINFIKAIRTEVKIRYRAVRIQPK